MIYKITKRSEFGHFVIFIDYNCKKAIALSDALDADPRLDCFQYVGLQNANVHAIHLRITDGELRRATSSEQEKYIDAICKPILSK